MIEKNGNFVESESRSDCKIANIILCMYITIPNNLNKTALTICGQRSKCLLQAFSPFSILFLKATFSEGNKDWGLSGTGLTLPQTHLSF